MFWSDITYEKLIDEVKSEVDIAVEINDEIYMRWLKTLITFLYTEIIKEQYEISYSTEYDDDIIDLTDIWFFGDPIIDYPTFEDIITIYADGVQLIKSTVASGTIFPNTFYKYSAKNPNQSTYVVYNTETKPDKFRIVFYVKPNPENTKVELPNEFIDLAKAKLRGEAYKLANEDALAAKWLNDYNTLLETFKVWIAEKSPKFGL